MRIHVTGASGSGTTTLGRAVAAALGCAQLDTDDYYWVPTVPPYQQKRDVAERVAMLAADLRPADVVLSGSIGDWGAEVEDVFDLVVFLYLPVEIRLARLERREVARHGAADAAFLEWAAQYDTGPPEGRSLAKHNAWLAQRKCRVLRLAEDLTVAQRVALVLAALRT